jgi:hypothetical protein
LHADCIAADIMPPSKTVPAAAVTLAALALAACDREYVYTPAVTTTSATSGGPSSPIEALRGDVQLTSSGFEEIQPGELDEAREPALHVRMAVKNESDKTWFVDGSEQLISLPDHGASRPALVTSDRGAASTVAVPPGEKGTIDLYYPLPDDMKGATKVPRFETRWNVWAGPRLVSERTPFERLQVEVRGSDPKPERPWRHGYWYDSAYHRSIFVGARIASHFDGQR